MRPPNFLLLFAVLLLTVTTITSARRVDMKINIGGGPVADFSGEEEFLQFGEEAVKTRFHGKIQGSGKDLQVFETQRFAREEDLVIDLPVPDGIYAVTLMFAETWDGAFEVGKRIFDVYLGSKPAGVVKVAENFDPFQAGGRASPVRMKYRGIATYSGLTIALRPIKQNPQLAGIVVTGFSYSEPLLDELPTTVGDLSEVEDFSILNNIGPRLPADPSNLYDPGLNPKLVESPRTQDIDPSSAFLPSEKVSTPGGTTMQDQHQSFASPGQLSNANSRLRESITSPSSQSVYRQGSSDRLAAELQTSLGASNSFSEGLASQLQTSSKTFRPIMIPMGTVRTATDTGSSSNSLSDGKHQIISNHKTDFPNELHSAYLGHHRYGRRLASTPAEHGAKAQLIEQDSSQSRVLDQNPHDSSSRELSSSDYLSPQPRQGASGITRSDYSTSSPNVEKLDREILSSGQTTGYIGPMDAREALTSTQNSEGTRRTSVNRQGQSRFEDEGNLYQLQRESIASSSPFSPSRDNPESTNLNAEGRSTIASRSNKSRTKSIAAQLNPAENESHVHGYHQNLFSDVLGNQEPTRRLSQGRTSGEYPPLPSIKFPVQQSSQEIRPRAEQREGAWPSAHGGEGSSQISGTGFDGDVHHFRGGFESQKENLHQGAPPARKLQGSRTAQAVERDTLHSLPQEIQSGTSHRGTGTSVGSVRSNALSLQEKQVETQNSVDGMPGLIGKESASTEVVPHTVRAIVGSDEVVRRASDTTIEGERRENYQMISRGSTISASSGQSLESVGSSRLHSLDSKAQTMMLPTVPSPGIHNGNGKLDGLCIHNSTHCSCGMVDQRGEAPEECLFVVDESVNPMVCVTRPCSGKVVCACAPGASALCQRSVVKSILVRATMTPSEGTEDPSVVACKREALEDGIMILTPII